MTAITRRREGGMSDTRQETERRVRERDEARGEEAARSAVEEERIDEEGRESFPASDPPSHTGITGEGRRDR
jgi:hypothetical protein